MIGYLIFLLLFVLPIWIWVSYGDSKLKKDNPALWNKQQLIDSYCENKYGHLKKYKHKGSDWNVDALVVSQSDDETSWVCFLMLKKPWPSDGTMDSVVIERFSNGFVNKMYKDEN